MKRVLYLMFVFFSFVQAASTVSGESTFTLCNRFRELGCFPKTDKAVFKLSLMVKEAGDRDPQYTDISHDLLKKIEDKSQFTEHDLCKITNLFLIFSSMKNVSSIERNRALLYFGGCQVLNLIPMSAIFSNKKIREVLCHDKNDLGHLERGRKMTAILEELYRRGLSRRELRDRV